MVVPLCLAPSSLFFSEVASPGQTSILVATEGTVKYEGNRERPFSQNFVLTEQSGVWKIVSDCFRFTDESE